MALRELGRLGRVAEPAQLDPALPGEGDALVDHIGHRRVVLGGLDEVEWSLFASLDFGRASVSRRRLASSRLWHLMTTRLVQHEAEQEAIRLMVALRAEGRPLRRSPTPLRAWLASAKARRRIPVKLERYVIKATRAVINSAALT